MPENIIATDLKRGSRISAGEYNTRGRLLQGIRRSNIPNTLIDSAGIQQRRSLGLRLTFAEVHTLFKIDTAATGDGVYNCKKQTLSSSEWTGVDGVEKLFESGPTNFEVLNLREQYVTPTYSRALAIGDLIDTFRLTDDEGNKRWVGVPIFTGNRLGRIDGAVTGLSATMNLLNTQGNEITSGLGSGLTVEFLVVQGSSIATASPQLEDDSYMYVQNYSGNWYCTDVLHGTEVCPC